jgi:hypothetical protein
LRLTARVDLPAPGRRQCVYVGLEYALAHTCVFAKQSLDAILCGRIGLGLCTLTYYRHPLFRSYGVILPSSFSVNHSSTLGYSPRLPVSDYGTVTDDPTVRGFSWQSACEFLCGGLRPLRHRLSTIRADLPTRKRLPPCIGTTTRRRIPRSCVPPYPQTDHRWYGNVDPFPIGYAFRPHLRDRLTLS